MDDYSYREDNTGTNADTLYIPELDFVRYSRIRGIYVPVVVLCLLYVCSNILQYCIPTPD
jgi:hypothetical protein